jgi:hypothetical protein
MTEQESLEAAIHEHVELVPYDVAWPKKFEAEPASASARLIAQRAQSTVRPRRIAPMGDG